MQPYNEIEIYPLDSSIKGADFLIQYKDKYYEVSQSMVYLIKELKEKKTIDEAIDSFIQKNDKYTFEYVYSVIEHYITPIFKEKNNVPTFLWEKELLTKNIVDQFSDKFYFLLKWQYIFCTFLFTFFLNSYFIFSTKELFTFKNSVNAYIIMCLILFSITSSFFHELGHASACKYFGIKHGGIGIGLYLNFPVLYTDVTNIWQLSRKHRFIVNIAGVYFQSILLLCLLIFYIFTNWDIIRYLILTLNLNFLITLNPFFKFDGYWIISDILGIPNLRQRSKEFFSYIIKSHKPSRKPYLLNINAAERYGFLIYSIIVNLFMGVYIFYIIPKFLYNLLISFPNEIQELILYTSNKISPSFALLRNITMQLLLLIFIIIFLVKIVQNVNKYVRKRKK